MSIEPYKTYRASGIDWLGDIPSHWEVKRLKHLGEAIIGLTYSPNDVVDEGQGTLVLRSSNIQNRRLSMDDSVYVTASIPPALRARAGDILICSRNGSRALIGKNIVIDEATAGSSFGAFMTVFRGSSNNYIRHVFNSYLFEAQSSSFLSSTINQLTSGNLLGMAVPLPSMAEQEAIAAFLDRETGKIDALVEEQRRLIELLKEKRQAVISHAVTKGLNPNAKMKPSGVEWLGEVPEHWDVVPCGYRYEVQLGRMLNEERAQGDDLRPYLRVLDVQWHRINVDDLPVMNFPLEARQRYRLQQGDLLVNEGGSYVGRSAIWRGELGECYYQKALHRLRPRDHSRDTAEFLLFVMEMATKLGAFIAGGNQTTIDHLTAEQLRGQRFPFPPIEEQAAIAQFLAEANGRLDVLEGEATAAIELLQERRAALISAAVTGKIDVREASTEQEDAA